MQRVKLADIIEFARNGASIKQSEDAKGFPISRIETIWNSTIDEDRLGYANIYDDDLIKYEKYLLKENDILITHINSPKHLGKSAIYKGSPEKLIHGMNLLCLRNNPILSNPKYLFYYLQTKYFKNQILKISNQSVNQASFAVTNLKDIEIPLPPLPTQKKIVTILDKADELRQYNKQLIEKYDTLTQSLFLEMFGDIDSNKKFPIGTIENFIEIVRDGPHISPKYSESGIPILSTRNIRPFQLINEEIKYVSLETYTEMTKRFKPQKGDVLLTKGGTTGFAKIVDWDWDFCIWVHLAALRVKEDVSPKYIESALNSYYGYNQSQGHTRGIANKDLGLKRMIKIQIPIPSFDLQNQFAERVQLIETQKQQAKEVLAKSEDLFQSLLQRAFKGELN